MKAYRVVCGTVHVDVYASACTSTFFKILSGLRATATTMHHHVYSYSTVAAQNSKRTSSSSLTHISLGFSPLTFRLATFLPPVVLLELDLLDEAREESLELGAPGAATPTGSNAGWLGAWFAC